MKKAIRRRHTLGHKQEAVRPAGFYYGESTGDCGTDAGELGEGGVDEDNRLRVELAQVTKVQNQHAYEGRVLRAEGKAAR